MLIKYKLQGINNKIVKIYNSVHKKMKIKFHLIKIQNLYRLKIKT